jgi:hypothetical protein
VSLVTLTLGLSLSACGTTTASSPEATLSAYSRALQDTRSDDAYALLSDTAKKSISLDQFRKMVKQNPLDARELGQLLGQPARPAEVTATVTAQNGQTLELVLERGRWKLDASAIDLYAQDTPRHALVGFVRAIDRKRYDIVLRYMPDAHRVGYDEAALKTAYEGPDKDEVLRTTALIRAALPSASVEETGDRATFDYGSGMVELLKERGAWKIERFD